MAAGNGVARSVGVGVGDGVTVGGIWPPVTGACSRALASRLTWPWARSVQAVVCSAVQEWVGLGVASGLRGAAVGASAAGAGCSATGCSGASGWTSIESLHAVSAAKPIRTPADAIAVSRLSMFSPFNQATRQRDRGPLVLCARGCRPGTGTPRSLPDRHPVVA